MKGSYRIIVSNAKLRYDFVVRRNITILKGDSATGKTTLLDNTWLSTNEFAEKVRESGKYASIKQTYNEFYYKRRIRP